MRRQVIQTHRNPSTLQYQAVETIPRNDRVLSPRSDKSLERRSKSIRAADLAHLNGHKGSQGSGNVSTSRHGNLGREEQLVEQLQRSTTLFINEIEKLKSDNRQLSYDNELLYKENEMIKNSMEHQIRQSKQSKGSHCSIEDIKNGYLESYYTRIKAIEERVQYYEAESKANQLYSNCFIEISKCLSKEELSIDELKSKIMNLMDQSQKYKEEIKRLDDLCRIKEHNTNEELQKIIMDFNETVFIKNELEIRIFDLTTENNSLRTKIHELNCRLDEQEVVIQRIGNQFNNLNTNLSTSGYQGESNIEQTRLNLEHLQRENEHLKLEIGTYKTKAEHYNGSQFNHRQQINRLNNFIEELNTKWHVEFEHNGVLQEERKNHLREITRLGSEIQRLNISLDDTRNSQSKFRLDIDSTIESKRIVEKEREIISEELRQLKQRNSEINHLNEKLEEELRSCNVKIGRLNDSMGEVVRTSQNKENNYLHELNSLREQINHLKTQWQISNENLISKEEEMRLICNEINQNSETTLESIKNESRLEIERERSHIRILNEKIRELESRIESMHKGGLQLETELSSKRMAIADLENTNQMRCAEYQQTIRRMEGMFNLEREKLIHTKTLLENELQLSNRHLKEIEETMYRMKESQLHQNQNLSYNNSNLQRTVEELEVIIHNLNTRLAVLDSVEKEKNRYQMECMNMEKEINNKTIQLETFMKKTNDEHTLRRHSYESEITSLQSIVQRNEEQYKSLRKEYQQRINELGYKNNELQNNLSKQLILLEQESRSQSHFQGILQELKKQYNTQLQGLKNDLLVNIQQQRQKNSDSQFEFLITKYEERLGNVVTSLEKILRDEGKGDKRQIEEWLNKEVRSIKDRCVEEVNKTRRDVNEFMSNERVAERNNNMKIMELENKIKSYEGILHHVSLQRTARINKQAEMSQRNFFQFQMISKENETLKQSNMKLTNLLNNSEQTILTLKNQLSTWSSRYDKMKMQSQLHEESLSQQIRLLKTSIAELEKYNVEVGTKATFTEHDRTLDRLTSMPDLNKSIHVHNRSVVETKTHLNPEISIIDEGGHRIKTIPNRIFERTVSPAQVVVNIIQKGKEEEQKMIQPSATVRIPNVVRNVSPKNQRSFGILPIILNEQPTSPTHRLRLAPTANKRNSISPSMRVTQNVQYAKNYQKNESVFVDRREEAKIKPIPYTPVGGVMMSPRMYSPPKPTSPRPIQSNLNYRTSTIKPQTNSTLQFPTGFSSKPTSPQHKQTKLSVTLLQNNALADKPRQQSREKPRETTHSYSNSDGRYCC